jgi:hypothetical protein
MFPGVSAQLAAAMQVGCYPDEIHSASASDLVMRASSDGIFDGDQGTPKPCTSARPPPTSAFFRGARLPIRGFVEEAAAAHGVRRRVEPRI